MKHAFEFLTNHARLITRADVREEADNRRSNNRYESQDDDGKKEGENLEDIEGHNSMQ